MLLELGIPPKPGKQNASQGAAHDAGTPDMSNQLSTVYIHSSLMIKNIVLENKATVEEIEGDLRTTNTTWRKTYSA